MSCKREPQSPNNLLLPQGEALRFEASFSGTKVHFTDQTGSDGQFSAFEWDTNDAVSIYSMKVFEDYTFMLNGRLEEGNPPVVTDLYSRDEEFAGYFVGSEICPVQVNTSNAAQASFTSSLPKTSWIDANDEDDQMYLFLSYYPAPTNGQIIPIKFFSFEGDNNFPFFHLYIPVEIPAEQDGVNYQKYQIMLDSGLATSEPNVKLKSQIMTDGATVSFNNYVPYTSILNFRLKLAPNETPVDIKKIEISIFAKETSDGDYVDTDNTPKLAGKVLALLLPDDTGQGYNSRLWYHSLYPGPVGNERDAIDLEGSDIDATNTLTLNFSSSLPLTDQDFSNYIKAVVLPSYNSAANNFGAPEVLFKAYDGDGNLRYASKKYTNSADGFEQGKRYNFDVVLYPNADFEAGNAGSYNEIIM